jgi:conjugative transfer signal peptidase TraF
MKRFPLPVLALGCATAIQVLLLAEGIVINHTPSLPEGFYRKKSRPVGKGCFVLFQLPESELSVRPYARDNLIKEIVAEKGDRICIGAAGVRVNGRMLANSAQLPSDRNGLPLPHLRVEDYTLKDGEFLTMSAYNPSSFDSRYFGLVRRGSVLAVVEPLLTW